MFRNIETPPVERALRSASYYDADYYSGKKSNWSVPYVWDNFAPIFNEWMRFILHVFPESISFLDVGCGRGFMEKAFEISKKSSLLPIKIHGFDHSEYAIATAADEAKPLIECAGIESFKFREAYDVMLAFDVFEHVSEEQVVSFLRRSRKHIRDCICAVIALDEPHQRNEASHCNLQDREYWHRIFLQCGWVQTLEYKMMNDLALKHDHVRNCKCAMFIYGAGEKNRLVRGACVLTYTWYRMASFMKQDFFALCKIRLSAFRLRLRSIKQCLLRSAPWKRNMPGPTTNS